MQEQPPAPITAIPPPSIPAIVAAAGFSRRMGELKQLLAWQGRTVIETVVAHLQRAGAHPVVCVVGHREAEIRAVLAHSQAQVVANPEYARGEMLTSYQQGVRALQNEHLYPGLLLALGDQPHLQVESIAQVLDQARRQPDGIVIPSFNLRRGHPIYLPRHLWPDLLALSGEQSLRNLLHAHAQDIVYVNSESDGVLQDMDTPEQYQAMVERYGRESAAEET